MLDGGPAKGLEEGKAEETARHAGENRTTTKKTSRSILDGEAGEELYEFARRRLRLAEGVRCGGDMAMQGEGRC